MWTHVKGSITVPPAKHLNLSVTHTTTLSPIPKNYRAALEDPNWLAAMQDEYNALVVNKMWNLIPRPSTTNLIFDKWVFKHKFNSDGTLSCYKARWVARGYSQQPDIDYDEMFSLVVKLAMIQTVLSIAVSHSWPIHQLDVKNAFLNGSLDETVYCAQPSGFVDLEHPTHVWKLHKSLYDLKQAARAWYKRFVTYSCALGFKSSTSDTSLFILRDGFDTCYQLLYVDDIIITSSSDAFLARLLGQLHGEFSMTNLEDLHFFLGIQVMRSSSGLFPSQWQYTTNLLQHAGMSDCHSTTTPVDMQAKLSATIGDPVDDPSLYRSLTGGLQYLTLTQPDIAYAIQQACLHMHDPHEPHLTLIKCITLLQK
jgi:hypothetical protein